jgi:YesN/AraC family two-component response regulator
MLKILIVDDSNFMRKNLGQMFSQLGHEVVGEAGNGVEAYHAYCKLKPDLLTMDVTMPKMEGTEAVKNIIADFPDAKIIMISALSQKDIVYDAITAGALTFLAKPVKAENVVKALRKIFPIEKLVSETQFDQFKHIFFKIQLKEEVFNIVISDETDGHPITSLPKAMDGILMVTPLKVVIDYGRMEKLPKEILEMVVTDFKKIKEIGGSVEIISHAKKDG